jgi:hypothetical protein
MTPNPVAPIPRPPHPVLLPKGRRNTADPLAQDKFGRSLSPWGERQSEGVLERFRGGLA